MDTEHGVLIGTNDPYVVCARCGEPMPLSSLRFKTFDPDTDDAGAYLDDLKREVESEKGRSYFRFRHPESTMDGCGAWWRYDFDAFVGWSP